jgi:hypothetical protein
MRFLPFVLGIIIGAAGIGIGTRAEAQNYPWCAMYNLGEDGQICGFVSYEQCMTTVSGIGGFCQQNTQNQSSVIALHPSPRTRKHSFHRPS